jgi:RND family efflux transporter MFP subunit
VKEALVEIARKEVLKAQSVSDYAFVRAPFDGVITYRGVDEGDFVQNASSGQTRLLMTVCAIDRVKAVLEIPDRQAVWVRAGTPAKIHFDSRTSWDFSGRVSRIAHSLDNQSRTMRVEIDLDNRNRALLPGMYGKVTLTLQEIENAWTVPATAVYTRKGESYVLQVTNELARRQRVRICYDDGKELEVVKLDGNREVPLDGTEELIISNKGEIAEGQRVTTPDVKQRRAMAAPANRLWIEGSAAAETPNGCPATLSVFPPVDSSFAARAIRPRAVIRLSLEPSS